MMRPPPRLTLFPYTTLFRSKGRSPVSNFTKSTTRRWAISADVPWVTGTPAARSALLAGVPVTQGTSRSEEHTSELQSLTNLVCRLLLEKKKKRKQGIHGD